MQVLELEAQSPSLRHTRRLDGFCSHDK
jgi:hypothetical protein